MDEQLAIHYDRMSPREAAAWGVLQTRRGKASALSVPALAVHVGVPERDLQEIVRSLIVRFGKPIGSTSGSPHGYYLCVDEADLLDNHRQCRKRGLLMLLRANAYRRDPMIEQFVGQECLDLDGAESGGRDGE